MTTTLTHSAPRAMAPATATVDRLARIQQAPATYDTYGKGNMITTWVVRTKATLPEGSMRAYGTPKGLGYLLREREFQHALLR